MLIGMKNLKVEIAKKEAELLVMKEALKKLEHKKTPAEKWLERRGKENPLIDLKDEDGSIWNDVDVIDAFEAGEVHNCLKYQKLFDKLHILHVRADHDSVSSMTKAVFDEFEILISGDK